MPHQVSKDLRFAKKFNHVSAIDQTNDDGSPFPRTVTRDVLLIDGTDEAFRKLLFQITSVASRIEQMRARFAKHLGITSPQYNVLLYLAQHQKTSGLTVNEVARALHVSGPHVTKETKALIAHGYLTKSDNPDDGRSVLLRTTPSCDQALQRLAPVLQAVNDTLFASIDEKDFDVLARCFQTILSDSENALVALEYFGSKSE